MMLFDIQKYATAKGPLWEGYEIMEAACGSERVNREVLRRGAKGRGYLSRVSGGEKAARSCSPRSFTRGGSDLYESIRLPAQHRRRVGH